jgi:hypothetical protein
MALAPLCPWLGTRSDHPRSIVVVSTGGTADFLRARDNQGKRMTWANARKRLLTCAVG